METTINVQNIIDQNPPEILGFWPVAAGILLVIVIIAAIINFWGNDEGESFFIMLFAIPLLVISGFLAWGDMKEQVEENSAKELIAQVREQHNILLPHKDALELVRYQMNKGKPYHPGVALVWKGDKWYELDVDRYDGELKIYYVGS